ncbi:MAG TPA: Sir2 family NAD-dependent protein deacetylase [Candidatus Acidoferrales bacterium]|nr:Sir2 family NAD-dependent protein deacetylase [Candidatus Acidoferrales bacterium]
MSFRILFVCAVTALLADCAGAALTPVNGSGAAPQIAVRAETAATQVVQPATLPDFSDWQQREARNPALQALFKTRTIHRDGAGDSWVNACGDPSPTENRCTLQIPLTLASNVGTETPDESPYPGKGYVYVPSDLQSIYDLPSKTGGAGETVALVESEDYANLVNDVNVFRKAYGLGTVNLQKYNEYGQTAPLPPGPTSIEDWTPFEQDLDAEMVSAICPNCKIIVVEAYVTNSVVDLDTAANTAYTLGADAISNSWSGPEGPNMPYMSDSLHLIAGSRNVLELHGNMREARCSWCGKRRSIENGLPLDEIEHECGGRFRPDIVWFGEPLPEEAWARAVGASERADVILVVGTSAVVYPAAALAAHYSRQAC